MPFKTFALVLSLAVTWPGFAQSGPEGYQFVIDPSKPYVYMQYDHVGLREPFKEGEPSTGVWLKIVNNCRVAIQIPVSGFQVLDEVVPVTEKDELVLGVKEIFGSPEGVQIIGESGGVPYVPSSVGAVQSESEIPAASTGPTATVPAGYRSGIHQLSLLIIPPSESYVFSVPINHAKVGEWHIRVEFWLAAGEPGPGGPSSYIEFFESQIPSEDRPKPDARSN